MDEQRTIESILAADIGSTLTHVCLIDLVDGVYRFVAHSETTTTIGQPEDDVVIGLRRAIRHIERITQRHLLDELEEIITPEQSLGEGVDAFAAVSNAADPVRCCLIGLTADLSIETAHRACSAANAVVQQTITLGMRAKRWSNKSLAQLRRAPPDVILLVGGVDMGPVAPLESAARVLVTVYDDIEPEQRPRIIFAGNQEARRPVALVLSSMFDLRVVDNVRPNVHTESAGELQRELEAVYVQTKLAVLPGYRRLRSWCAFPIMATSEGMGNTLRFIAQRNELSQGVLGVDVGGSATYVGAASGGVYRWATGASVGTGHGITNVLELSSTDDIRRWLPLTLPGQEIVSRLENAALRPHGIPQSMEDMFLTHAVVRQAILLTMRRMRGQHWFRPDSDSEDDTTPTFDLIAARGGSLAHTAQDGLLVLTLLDALQPIGIVRLVIDWASIWPQIGALAQAVPMAASQVLERDSFRELGTVIAPTGDARDGDHALAITIERDDGRVIEADVPAGAIQRFPLALSEHATVRVRPSRAFDIGIGRKGIGGMARVRGGSLGIIVDTRGRPLHLPHNPKRCRSKLQEWLGSLIHDVDSSS